MSYGVFILVVLILNYDDNIFFIYEPLYVYQFLFICSDFLDSLHCPWLPAIAAAGVVYMAPAEVYSLLASLVNGGPQYAPSRQDTWMMLYELDYLASRLVPAARAAYLAQHSTDASDHPFAGIVGPWLLSLPFFTRMMVIDNFFVCGKKIFFRIGLALLARWARMPDPSSLDEVASATADTSAFIKEAFAFKCGTLVCGPLTTQVFIGRYQGRVVSAAQGVGDIYCDGRVCHAVF